MSVGDIYECSILGRQDGQITATVFHYRQASGNAGDQSGALAASVDGSLAAGLKTTLSPEWSYDLSSVARVSPLPRTAPTLNSTNAGPGTIGTFAAPSSVAAVLKKKTALAGRKYRGRFFLPGVPLSVIADSQLTAGGVTSFAAMATLLQGNIVNAAGTFNPVIFHRASLTFDNITSVTVDPVLRNQRRRQVGRGV